MSFQVSSCSRFDHLLSSVVFFFQFPISFSWRDAFSGITACAILTGDRFSSSLKCETLRAEKSTLHLKILPDPLICRKESTVQVPFFATSTPIANCIDEQGLMFAVFRLECARNIDIRNNWCHLLLSENASPWEQTFLIKEHWDSESASSGEKRSSTFEHVRLINYVTIFINFRRTGRRLKH